MRACSSRPYLPNTIAPTGEGILVVDTSCFSL